MIELAKVRLDRGQRSILRGAFVRIEAEQVVLISGPSGIGKTSLLSLIGGLLTASEGAVKVFGRDVARLRVTSASLLRRKLAFVPQELALLEESSALANVRLALEVCGVRRREAKRRAFEALKAVDLEDEAEQRVSKLSTGQRRRVSLARGLVRDASIIVADEPSNDLDADRVLLLVGSLEERREDGAAVVIATNDPRLLSQATQPGWRHLALQDGQLVPGELSTLFSARRAQRDTLQAEGSSEESNVVPFPLSAAAGGESL